MSVKSQTRYPSVGVIRTCYVDERTGNRQWMACFRNTVLYSGAFIMAQLLRGKPEYKVNAMYLEFENVSDPDTTVSIPVFDRDEGTEYYEALGGTRDYLRVALVGEPALAIASGFTTFFDEAKGEGNRVDFFAQSSGSNGVRGLEFSSLVNSKVYGLALVATPEWDDRAQDVIYSRGYYPTSKQMVKQSSSQIGASWQHTFGFDE